MTTRPIVSVLQLDVLEAAAAGRLALSQQHGESYPHWRIQLDDATTKPVTRTANGVLTRGLIAKGDRFTDDDPTVLARGVPTHAGRAILDDLRSRIGGA